MKYSLAIYNDNDFVEIENYAMFLNLKSSDEHSLEGIVKFSNMFGDEDSLMAFLMHYNLIPSEFIAGKVQINAYKSKNAKPKILPYGISFCQDKKFFNTQFLQKYFSEKMTDMLFIELFIQKYYNYLKDVGAFSEELKAIKYYYEILSKDGYLPKDAQINMSSFVLTYCGYKKTVFSKVRELAMFAIDYERTYKRTYELGISSISDLELELDHYTAIVENGDLDDEQIDAYLRKIEGIKKEINKINRLRLIKNGENNAVTEN